MFICLCISYKNQRDNLFILHYTFFVRGDFYMIIRLDILAPKLKSYNPELYLSDNDFKPLSGVRLLDKKQGKLKPNYLYIGKLSDLQNLSFTEDTINILCIADKAIAKKYTKMTNLNLLILRTNVDLTSLLIEILNYFTKEQDNTQSLTRLLEAFTHGKDIQHILDIGYDVIGNPIFLTDANFKLLAYTKHIEVDDFLWNELIQNGYFRSESIFYFRIEKTLEKVTKSSSPILFPESKPIPINNTKTANVMRDSIIRPRIISNIFIDNKIVATLCVIQHFKNFQSHDMDLVEILCEAVSSEMRKSSYFSKTKGMMYEYFIADLLNGDINNALINERIRALDCNIKKNFCVIAICDKQFDKENMPFNHFRTILENIIGTSKSIEYDGSIILIVNNNRENPLSESDIKDLKDFLLKYNLYGGISYNFDNLIHIRKFYQQAVTAIQIGYRSNKEAVLYYYKDLAIFDMFDIFSTQRDLKDLCHPALLSLLEYDEKYKTNFADTLHAYVQNGQSQTKSANTLHIHRNTLTYRISKIAKIMRIDLDDSTLMLHLHLSFKILDYVNWDSNNKNI